MTKTELLEFLYGQIPLSKAMGVRIIEASQAQVILEAPLDSNSNHLDTAFGGSLGTLLILSCYTWLYHKLKTDGLESHVLIKECQTKYLHPVKSNLQAICLPPEEEAFKKFLNSFERKGLGRLTLQAKIVTNEGVACEFIGEFVAQG